MIVLSLFDGMSCGQIALKELGAKVDKYYASEIDKHAIKQTKLNFPDTIQLGSVTDVDVSKLDKIDLLIGGSPCTNFSFAGKRNGMSTTTNEEIYTLDRYLELKKEGFQFEGESFLFWEYMRILNDIRKYNPNVKFLLENVEMGKKWERTLSEAIGLFGVHINSALVSAQNRKRIYWTNIRTKQMGLFGEVYSDIPQPEDRGILLKDILEDGVEEKYYLNADVINKLVQHRERHKELGHGFGAKFHNKDEKMQALKVGGKGIDDLVCISNSNITCLTPNRTEFGKQIRKKYEVVEIIPCASMPSCDISDKFVIDANGRIDSDKTGTITARYAKGINKFGSEPFVCVPCDYRHDEGIRFKADGKTCTLLSRARNDESCGQMVCVASLQEHATVSINKSTPMVAAMGMGGGHVPIINPNKRIRRLTPTECSRLQTIPEWYKWECSDTQAYRMLGNGWTVEVIKHIFQYIEL